MTKIAIWILALSMAPAAMAPASAAAATAGRQTGQNTWDHANRLPVQIAAGGRITAYDGDRLIMTRGGGSAELHQYEISTATWSVLASVPDSVQSGSALVTMPGSSFIIAATTGTAAGPSFKFHRGNPQTSPISWSQLSELARPANAASIVLVPALGKLYALFGFPESSSTVTPLWVHDDPVGDPLRAWRRLHDSAAASCQTPSLAWDGADHMYFGTRSYGLYRYTISSDSWDGVAGGSRWGSLFGA